MEKPLNQPDTAPAGLHYRRRIDDLGAKRKLARAKFRELETATSADWVIVEADFERALNELRVAFKKVAN